MGITATVQRAIVDTLKADTDLTTALGGSTEIREDDWPGPDWNFPAVRVALNSLIPTTSGKCHLTLWTITFSVFVYTQPTLSAGIYDASTLQCADLMDDITEALHGVLITYASDLVAETAVNISGRNAPVPEFPPGGWRGEVLGEMSAIEV